MIAEILNSYDLHLGHLRNLVADLSEDQMVAQPQGVANHPAWTIGHLTQSCEAIGGELGLSPWLPYDWGQRFGTGSVPLADRSAYPNRTVLLSTLDEGKARIERALRTMTQSDLAKPLPDIRFRDRFPTVGHAVVHILSGHTAMHLGQLTVWRRAMEFTLPSEPSVES